MSRIPVHALWVLLAVPLAGCACPAERSPDPGTARLDPAVASSGTPAGRFVGSAECAPCHEEIHARWEKSRHRLTLRPLAGPGSSRLLGTEVEGFEVAPDGSASGPGAAGDSIAATAAYALGGEDREDLLVRMDDGRLQVWLVSHDAGTGLPFEPVRVLAGGARPPGDSIDHWTRMGRSADLRCYGCHATGARLVTSGVTAAGNPAPRSRWVEPGVGCEGCHGPGGPHVDAAREGIRRPYLAGSDPRASCEGCHALRELLPSPFGTVPAHPYGTSPWTVADPIAGSAADFEFREALLVDMRPATYQQEAVALSQSGCARAGGLTCGDCHDVHDGALREAATVASGGSEVCARCHAGIVTKAASHSGHAAGTPGGRCFDCHMPPVLRGPGREPARDHSLAPPVGRPGEVPGACAVCHEGMDSNRIRSKLPRSAGPASSRRLALRAAVEASLVRSEEAPKRLAAIAADRGESWFLRWAALDRLASLARREVPAVREAARRAIEDPHPVLRRAACRVLAGWGTSQDLEALGRLAGSADPYEAIVATSAIASLGAADAGARISTLLRRPEVAGTYRAHALLGRFSLLARDFPRAAEGYSRALELHPVQVPALTDLGIALAEIGRTEEAREAWERALEWNPRYEAARRNLEGLEELEGP